MSKQTMTILAAVAAVFAVLALGVVIGFAVDSDDVDVADDAVANSVDDESRDDESRENEDSGGFPDSDDGSESDSPAEIEGFGDFFECLQDAGLGFEDLQEFDLELDQFFSECVGGIIGESFSTENFGPFGSLEEFFGDIEDGENPFNGERLEEFFGDFFGENEDSDTGA